MTNKNEINFKSKAEEIEFLVGCAKELVAMIIENIDIVNKSRHDINIEVDNAIQSGLNFIKETDWHKGLTPDNKLKSLRIIEKEFKIVIGQI